MKVKTDILFRDTILDILLVSCGQVDDAMVLLQKHHKLAALMRDVKQIIPLE